MVPALRSLEENGIFTSTEIRSLISKRRDYEYTLRRRTVRKTDFLLYLEFEMNLLKLFKIRKSSLPKMKPAVCDFHIEQHIHLTFVRALRKFKTDVSFWLQYIDFCKKNDSGKKLGGVYGEVLAIHPHVVGIWIDAASWEFFDNANAKNARVLLQRGLRINKTCQQLFLQYFNLEFHYIQKMRGRREILQLHGKRSKAMEESGTYNGEVPRLIFAQAIKSVPNDVAFRLKFLDMCAEFPQTEEVESMILESIKSDFSTNEEAWVARALHYYKGGTDVQTAISTIEEGIETVSSATMYIAAVNFGKKVCESLPAESSLAVANWVGSVLQKASSIDKTSVDLQQMRAEFFLNTGEVGKAVVILESGCKEFGNEQNSVDLWVLWGSVLARRGGGGQEQGLKDGIKVLQMGLVTIAFGLETESAYEFWKIASTLLDLLLLVGDFAGVEGMVIKAPQTVMMKLAEMYLRHKIASEGVEGMRYVYNFVRMNAVGGDPIGFYSMCLGSENDVSGRRGIYETLLASTVVQSDGVVKEGILGRWEEEERGRGEGGKANMIAIRRAQGRR